MKEDKDWQIDNYKTEYFITKIELEYKNNFLKFLEENYLSKSLNELKKEFDNVSL